MFEWRDILSGVCVLTFQCNKKGAIFNPFCFDDHGHTLNVFDP